MGCWCKVTISACALCGWSYHIDSFRGTSDRFVFFHYLVRFIWISTIGIFNCPKLSVNIFVSRYSWWPLLGWVKGETRILSWSDGQQDLKVSNNHNTPQRDVSTTHRSCLAQLLEYRSQPELGVGYFSQPLLNSRTCNWQARRIPWNQSGKRCPDWSEMKEDILIGSCYRGRRSQPRKQIFSKRISLSNTLK